MTAGSLLLVSLLLTTAARATPGKDLDDRPRSGREVTTTSSCSDARVGRLAADLREHGLEAP